MPDNKSTAKRKAPSVHSDSGDDEYRKKRDRNNQAVKKSRQKSNKKTKETKDRVDKLKVDNDELEVKAAQLQDKVKYLKNLLLCKDIDPEEHKREIAKILAEKDEND
ncbi:hypothetical protein ACFFRR_008301 [Megaselia abdita]